MSFAHFSGGDELEIGHQLMFIRSTDQWQLFAIKMPLGEITPTTL
jgi:hypothetical protein